MKKLLVLVIAALTAGSIQAADQVPLFNAQMTTGAESRFVLLSTEGQASGWLRLGDEFDGYKLKRFDAAAGALELERDGRVVKVALVAEAAVKAGPTGAAATKATLADAENVLKVMKFEELMKKLAEQQSKTMAPMFKQMAERMKLEGVDQEKFVALQQKIVGEMMNAMSGPDVQQAMAQVYSDVFSKEELGAMANFYATPVGQAMVDKQPEVTQKLNGVLMPKMMAMMPRIQQLTQQFAAEQKAAHAATPGAPAPSAPTVPKP